MITFQDKFGMDTCRGRIEISNNPPVVQADTPKSKRRKVGLLLLDTADASEAPVLIGSGFGSHGEEAQGARNSGDLA